MPQLLPPPAGVTIRMYRSGGLGDCFLLAFAGTAPIPCYVLIDCGVFYRTPGAESRMQRIAADIEAATGGRIDVLVATHEHWDHLSGFGFAQDVFKRLHVGEVWVAWTEDPQHPLASQLQQRHQQALQALVAATQRLQAANDPRAADLQQLLAFHGPLAAGAAASTREQLQFVQTLGPVRYCRPGQPPLSLPTASGVKAYVLGPPEDETLLKRSTPRRGQVYEQPKPFDGTDLHSGTQSGSFYAAALAEPSAVDAPFSPPFVLPLSKLADPHSQETYTDFFRARYGFTDAPGSASWRRIDQDWLGAAEHLALDMDDDTNNTSLVLAFELPDGRVLLFPGDAQAGNWLSWASVQWQAGEQVITGQDLLRRVAVYKVGHHGSHNATLAAQGLELMERDDLIALLPVDETQARQKKWKMPFGPLYERLQTKTSGRVVRADAGIPDQPAGVADQRWQQFLSQVRSDTSTEQLWVELDITA
jgi:hypothetical protein